MQKISKTSMANSQTCQEVKMTFVRMAHHTANLCAAPLAVRVAMLRPSTGARVGRRASGMTRVKAQWRRAKRRTRYASVLFRHWRHSRMKNNATNRQSHVETRHEIHENGCHQCCHCRLRRERLRNLTDERCCTQNKCIDGRKTSR